MVDFMTNPQIDWVTPEKGIIGNYTYYIVEVNLGFTFRSIFTPIEKEENINDEIYPFLSLAQFYAQIDYNNYLKQLLY